MNEVEFKPSYYAIIPANVRYDKRLSANAKLLYGEITALANSTGYCYATNRYFAELYDVTNTSISLWVKQLIDCGHINSHIQYREGTKEILNRYLSLAVLPIEKKLNTPIEEKLKDNNTVINNTINNTTQKERFEKIWAHYPLKKGKENAFKSYQKAIKDGAKDLDILNGIKRYNQELKLS